MKNILVPTDFSQQSLEVIHQLIKKQQYRQANIFLVHIVHMPTDPSELLFIRKNKLYDAVPYHFLSSIELLRSTYPAHINTIRLEFYYGDNYRIFESIIENLQIDEICLLANYTYLLPLDNSVNIIFFIDRCQLPVYRIELPVDVNPGAGVKVSYSIFTNQSAMAATS